MRTRTAVLWWLGWHPLAAVSVGVFAGVVAGNVLLTWGVRAAMLGGGVSRYGEAFFEPVVGQGTAYLLSLAFVPVVGAASVGVVVGGVLWYAGVRTIDRHAEAVLDRVLGRLGQTAAVSTAPTLTGGRGSVPLVDGHRTYGVSLVRLDEDAASFDEYELRMADRRTDRVDAVRVPYDRVDSVRYDGSSLHVGTRERDYAAPVSDAPTEVLDALYASCSSLDDVGENRP